MPQDTDLATALTAYIAELRKEALATLNNKENIGEAKAHTLHRFKNMIAARLEMMLANHPIAPDPEDTEPQEYEPESIIHQLMIEIAHWTGEMPLHDEKRARSIAYTINQLCQGVAALIEATRKEHP